jgi:hypothetical protein
MVPGVAMIRHPARRSYAVGWSIRGLWRKRLAVRMSIENAGWPFGCGARADDYPGCLDRHGRRVGRRGGTSTALFDNPFVGYRFGGKLTLADTNTRLDALNHVSYGVAIDLATDTQTQYELFYSRESTRLSAPSPTPSNTAIEYLHLGGTVNIGETPRFQPYFVATLGATRFSPDAPVGNDRIYFSGSLGGGLRVPLNGHLALRLEARGFATFFSSQTAVFCRSDQAGGVCRIHGSGSTFFQGDALAGLTYTF